MRLSDLCFVSAVPAALLGMAAGIFMGITEDFTLTPAHAHLNLLGWVTMALVGLYHRGAGSPRGRLATAQVWTSIAGFWLMPVGLGLYLGLQDERFVPMVMIGSVLALAGMLLFAVVVFRDLRAQARPRTALHPNSR
jgi:cbb3-type cytochrome oxidase subunit 1